METYSYSGVVRFQGWIASLSNGENVFEAPLVEGERSSWQKLLERCRQEGLTITMLRLQRNGITLHSMPQKMCSGVMQAYEATRVVFRNTTKLRQGIGSVIGDQVHITWIELDGNGSMVYLWQDVRPLEECKIHALLRE